MVQRQYNVRTESCSRHMPATMFDPSSDSLVKSEPAMLVSPCPLMSTTVKPLEMTATDCRMMRRPVRLLLPLTDSSVRALRSVHKQQNIDFSVECGNTNIFVMIKINKILLFAFRCYPL